MNKKNRVQKPTRPEKKEVVLTPVETDQELVLNFLNDYPCYREPYRVDVINNVVYLRKAVKQDFYTLAIKVVDTKEKDVKINFVLGSTDFVQDCKVFSLFPCLEVSYTNDQLTANGYVWDGLPVTVEWLEKSFKPELCLFDEYRFLQFILTSRVELFDPELVDWKKYSVLIGNHRPSLFAEYGKEKFITVPIFNTLHQPDKEAAHKAAKQAFMKKFTVAHNKTSND